MIAPTLRGHSRCHPRLPPTHGCQEVGLKRRFSGRAGGHPRRPRRGTPQTAQHAQNPHTVRNATSTHNNPPQATQGAPLKSRETTRERGQKRSLTRHEKRSLTRGADSRVQLQPQCRHRRCRPTSVTVRAWRERVGAARGTEPQDHPNQMSAWINPTVCAEMGPKNVTQAGSRRTLRSSDSDALSGGFERSVMLHVNFFVGWLACGAPRPTHARPNRSCVHRPIPRHQNVNV